MRILANAIGVARTAGLSAGFRTYRHSLRSVTAAFLDELASLLLLLRAKLLRKD